MKNAKILVALTISLLLQACLEGPLIDTSILKGNQQIPEGIYSTNKCLFENNNVVYDDLSVDKNGIITLNRMKMFDSNTNLLVEKTKSQVINLDCSYETINSYGTFYFDTVETLRFLPEYEETTRAFTLTNQEERTVRGNVFNIYDPEIDSLANELFYTVGNSILLDNEIEFLMDPKFNLYFSYVEVNGYSYQPLCNANEQCNIVYVDKRTVLEEYSFSKIE